MCFTIREGIAPFAFQSILHSPCSRTTICFGDVLPRRRELNGEKIFANLRNGLSVYPHRNVHVGRPADGFTVQSDFGEGIQALKHQFELFRISNLRLAEGDRRLVDPVAVTNPSQ